MKGKFNYPPTEPGDYGRVRTPKPEHLPQRCWELQLYWDVRAPDGSTCILNPLIHTVTEHDDGAITVWPSIVTDTWHGWLRNGVWTSV